MKLSDETREYLSQFDARLLTTREGRRILTRLNPRLFAIVYLRKHISSDDSISFSEAQLDWYDQMLSWVKQQREPKEWRRAFVAPRASAKSTTWFLIAPLWAAAHGHVQFCAAFADSATQAEGHLQTFKAELDTNELLQSDYPELCAPLKNPRGWVVAQRNNHIQQASGFTFAARGVDAASLGLKVGEKRPDLIILDDIEPTEANYSVQMSEKRLSTIQNALLPINEKARVCLVGTVTMNDSLIHQMVKTVQSSEEPAAWVGDEGFEVHYYPAILQNDDGSERSLWPEKWPIEYLQQQRGTRSFALNFMNHPVSLDGDFWSPEDIQVSGTSRYDRTIISVDPAVTSKQSSDATGIAVLSYDQKAGVMTVRDCWAVRLDPKALRKKISDISSIYPEARVLLVETNQGGDAWSSILGDLPIKLRQTKNTAKKELRAAWLLNGYQRSQVLHAKEMPKLVSELLGFPGGLHDDQVDALSTGWIYFTGAGTEKKPKPGAKQLSYR